MNSTIYMLEQKAKVQDKKEIKKWHVYHFDTVASTNDIARNLTPWSAVIADIQTLGRGRYGRHWVSDRGGLWLSMVVPVRGERRRWKALPLAAGWAVLKVVKALGVDNVRLRWPNDIMVNDLKLAGVLVEQFCEEMAVVGVGINVTNSPVHVCSNLARTVTRLSDVIYTPPCILDLVKLILKAMTSIHYQMDRHGFPILLNEINASWGTPCRVKYETDGGIQQGFFVGINEYGDQIIENESGYKQIYSPLQVKLFREI